MSVDSEKLVPCTVRESHLTSKCEPDLAELEINEEESIFRCPSDDAKKMAPPKAATFDENVQPAIMLVTGVWLSTRIAAPDASTLFESNTQPLQLKLDSINNGVVKFFLPEISADVMWITGLKNFEKEECDAVSFPPIAVK